MIREMALVQCIGLGLRFRRLNARKGWQQGQALAELLVAALVLCMLWAAAAWLGRLQDMALQAGHAARHLAFLGAQQADEDWGKIARASYFDEHRHRWTDRSGQALLASDGQGVSAQVSRLAPVAQAAQPGSGDTRGATLRRDWRVADEGVMQAQVVLRPAAAPQPTAGPAWGDALRGFDAPMPVIRRQAYILVGAGHAGDDAQVRQRVAQAALPWAQAAGVSQGWSSRVEGFMSRVEHAWGRPVPGGDWLQPWQAWLPAWHLSQVRRQP